MITWTGANYPALLLPRVLHGAEEMRACEGLRELCARSAEGVPECRRMPAPMPQLLASRLLSIFCATDTGERESYRHEKAPQNISRSQIQNPNVKPDGPASVELSAQLPCKDQDTLWGQ